MPFEQKQRHTAGQDTTNQDSTITLAVVQKELIDARRELLRWKMLANQHQERLKEIESSASWRYSAVIRLIPQLLRRWKALLLTAIAALLLLPLSPVLLLAVLFPAGRNLLWSLIARVGPIRDLLRDVWARLHSVQAPTRGAANTITPLIYQRRSDGGHLAEPSSSDHARWRILQLLSPQRRLILQKFGLTREHVVGPHEMPELLSLSRSEVSILTISAAGYSVKDQAKV